MCTSGVRAASRSPTAAEGSLMSGLWLFSYAIVWGLVLVLALALLLMLHNLNVIYQELASLKPATQSNLVRTKLTAGIVLPEAHLATLDGTSLVSSQFYGTKTALLVVSPTCVPCRSLVQNIVAGEQPADPLDPSLRQIVIISLSDAVLSARFVDDLQLPQNMIMAIDYNHDVVNLWGVTSTPTTVIIDSESHVVRQVFGVGTQVDVQAEGQVSLTSSPEGISLHR